MTVSRKSLTFLLLLVMTQSGCGTSVESSSEKNPKEARCNLATIYRLGDGDSVQVRQSHNLGSKITANLSEGQIVYVCDDFEKWLNIYFSGVEAPCFRAYEGGLRKAEAKKCKSGWVEEKWVNIISG
jgi:hypothetical protein